MTPPDDAREKTWTKDPKTAALGAGTIELTATGPHGDVTGSAQGALGDIVMSGTFDGSELRASVWPKDPKDPAAMTGWMLLTAASGKPPRTLTGHMRVASPDAKIVREADVSVEPR